MAKSKMTTCKHCGAEIAASAKVCPHWSALCRVRGFSEILRLS